MPVLSRALLLCTALTLALPLQAEDWSQCMAPLITRDISADNLPSTTEIEADLLHGFGDESLQFSGNIILLRGKQRIDSDELEILRNPDRVKARGNITFSDELYQVESDRLELNQSDNSASFFNNRFTLYDNHLRGSADSIEQQNADYRELHQVRFTTCDPGDNDWSLSAGKLELDQTTRQGTAHDATLRIGKVPVFYFPWFMFPLGEERMSGLLSPTLSSNNKHGSALALPIYWNQAPNYDMTITPVWYSKRSLQWNSENRYLFDSNAGELHLSWLDDDLTNDERWMRRWRHRIDGPAGIVTTLDLNRVSDVDFLEDFDGTNQVEYVDFLRSSVNLSRAFADWNANLLFEEHQITNDSKGVASQPYRRLPQLTLNRRQSTEYGALNLAWRNEFVRFDKDDRITGDRLHLQPAISYPLQQDAYFFNPQLQLDYTRYQLDNNSNGANDIERSLPLLSIDSGLFFERSPHDSNWTQTLEPRLYLLYVPYEDQQDIPGFDSALLAENYGQLFRNNRFSGRDRIGDSKQASLGLTTRLIDEDEGREFFSASIGQAFFAEERRVSLNGSTDARDKSSLMSQLRYSPTAAWSLTLDSAYDQEEKESLQTDLALRYRAGREVFNLEYHKRDESLEQSVLSFVYPMSSRWTGYFKHHYSIRKERPVQNLAGLTYESCCWRFDLLYEEDSNSELSETDYGVLLQLTFKGLASAGKDISAILEDGILGYRSPY